MRCAVCRRRPAGGSGAPPAAPDAGDHAGWPALPTGTALTRKPEKESRKSRTKVRSYGAGQRGVVQGCRGSQGTQEVSPRASSRGHVPSASGDSVTQRSASAA